jgi:hypothetical protein
LKAAFSSGDTTGAVALFDKLSGLFVKVMNDIGVIPVPMRVVIESTLALADIAIHLIANHLKKTVLSQPALKAQVQSVAGTDPAVARGVVTISAIADSPSWGKHFRK